LKAKFLFLLFITVTFSSCDPENDFYIKGKIINQYSKEPIDNVEIELTYYSSSRGWRNIEKQIENNRSGIFNDTIASLRRYDSVKMLLRKEGYASKEIKTEYAEWETSRGFMKIEFEVNFGIVELKKN